MSLWRMARVAGTLGVSLTCWGCGGPTAPSYPQSTENYMGVVNAGEGVAFHFTVTNPGSIDAYISSLAPISTLAMGLQLGLWTSDTESCSRDLYTEAARVNLVISGTPQGPGEYCIEIYDVGNVQDTSDFSLVVHHY